MDQKNHVSLQNHENNRTSFVKFKDNNISSQSYCFSFTQQTEYSSGHIDCIMYVYDNNT
jgi:hypothetical protein